MSPETTKTKLCPVCGTRLAENATRCVVCGSEFNATPKQKAKVEKSIQPARMPSMTLSLPFALGIMAVLLFIGAGGVYFGLKGTDKIVEATVSPTRTETPTQTLTPTETLIPSETPTLTLEPPVEYIVQAGDNCGSIAGLYGSNINAIISLNHLNSQCTNLVVGKTILVPRPTATPPPAPTSTLESGEATRAACEVVKYTVQTGDTLSSIATNYAISISAIKSWNGLSTDSVMLGSVIQIPLCMRNATAGPTPTPTLPPPYPAPNLLLPADGAPFTIANDSVVLQWASIGTLRDNEAYQVTVEDVTYEMLYGNVNRIIEYVTDTKYIVPVKFRPADTTAHLIRWWVTPVRQTGTDDQGNPIWSTAGTASEVRGFTWSGAAAPAPTPTK